jgi:hypothetical protein
MSCQARVFDEEFTIPGTSVICHTTKECSAKVTMKVSIDDGEGRQGVCKDCFKRFNSKGGKNDRWYGWFDCDYPENAPVMYSPWYYAQMKPQVPLCEVTVNVLDVVIEKMQVMTVAPGPAPAEPEAKAASKKEMLLQEIAAITAWIKGEGKTKFKEQPAMHKKLMNLKTQIKLLKK